MLFRLSTIITKYTNLLGVYREVCPVCVMCIVLVARVSGTKQNTKYPGTRQLRYCQFARRTEYVRTTAAVLRCLIFYCFIPAADGLGLKLKLPHFHIRSIKMCLV